MSKFLLIITMIISSCAYGQQMKVNGQKAVWNARLGKYEYVGSVAETPDWTEYVTGKLNKGDSDQYVTRHRLDSVLADLVLNGGGISPEVFEDSIAALRLAIAELSGGAAFDTTYFLSVLGDTSDAIRDDLNGKADRVNPVFIDNANNTVFSVNSLGITLDYVPVYIYKALSMGGGTGNGLIMKVDAPGDSIAMGRSTTNLTIKCDTCLVNGSPIATTADLTNKVGVGDTAAMLSAYVRTVRFLDSLSAMNTRVAAKVGVGDTAAMLSAYVRTVRFLDSINAVRAGNVATATALRTARSINGVPFNGTADISVHGLIGVQVYSVPGTYTFTPTPGTRILKIEMYGGGGGTGSTYGGVGVFAFGAGAGAGAPARATITTIGWSSTTVTVGAGGSAGAVTGTCTTTPTPGGTGGTTSFVNGAVTISAPGGNGSLGSAFITAAKASAPATGGGPAVNADFPSYGQSGFEAYGNSTSLMHTGSGGSSAWGQGGTTIAALGSGAPGNPGLGFGSGAGGGVATGGTCQAGGAGAPGLIIIEMHY